VGDSKQNAVRVGATLAVAYYCGVGRRETCPYYSGGRKRGAEPLGGARDEAPALRRRSLYGALSFQVPGTYMAALA
jgi:hypothetical protein